MIFIKTFFLFPDIVKSNSFLEYQTESCQSDCLDCVINSSDHNTTQRAETGIWKAEILRQRDAKRSSAFLTGLDVIDSDLKELEVEAFSFDKNRLKAPDKISDSPSV
jgi:hypothetical protein